MIFGLRVLPFKHGEQLLDLDIGRHFALLLHPPEIALEALDRAAAGEAGNRPHHVDEQDAIEVIDLVLPGARLQVADDEAMWAGSERV